MNENQQFYYDNVNASNISECSEDYNLWRACISGDSEKVESLLQEGANPDARNEKGETPLILKYCAKYYFIVLSS
jgi:ankyrin repeat protein